MQVLVEDGARDRMMRCFKGSIFSLVKNKTDFAFCSEVAALCSSAKLKDREKGQHFIVLLLVGTV